MYVGWFTNGLVKSFCWDYVWNISLVRFYRMLIFGRTMILNGEGGGGMRV